MPYDPILLAEDDENDVFIMRRSLEKARIVHPLVVCRDGLETVNYLKTLEGVEAGGQRFPLWLMLDIKMPVMGGFEVLQWIRRQPQLNRLIVVMVSSSKHPEDVARAYDMHANSFLVKRGSIDEMAEMLRSVHNYWFCWNEKPNLQVPVPRDLSQGGGLLSGV